MSLKKHQTEQEGFGLPCFPEAVDRLNTLYNKLELDEIQFATIAEIISGRFWEPWFMRLMPTSDGYTWRWALDRVKRTKTFTGSTAVFFPWKNDELKVDGSSADRSIAVYPEKGKCTEKDAYYLCRDLVKCIEAALAK
ncbi:MAG: hypothetical protein ABIB98_02715 [bacterium]